jgi:hypothetical protein
MRLLMSSGEEPDSPAVGPRCSATCGGWASRVKKSLTASERDREDVKLARRTYRCSAGQVDPRRLVFLDESGVRTDLTRTHARGPRGERVWDAVPHGRWKTVTAIAAVTLDGPVAPFAFEGATDTAAFRTYTEKVLAPELLPGDIVVMDNLSVHKAAGVAEAIERRGAKSRLPATVQPGPEPGRTLVGEGQAAAPLRSSQVDRSDLQSPGPSHRRCHRERLPQLVHALRILTTPRRKRL